MKAKKKRLRLKRQVVTSIPVIITVIILAIFLSVNKSDLSTKEISLNDNITETNFISDYENSMYLKFIDNAISNRQRENTIIYYAEKYHLNSNNVLDIVKKLTNNFTDEKYLSTYAIGNIEEKFTNEEAGIVYFVRDLSRYPNKYGVSEKDIKVNTAVERDKKYENGTIILQSGLTYEQFLGHICDLYGLDKNIVLAISYLESGYLKSYLASYKNNFGGQRSGGVWLEYPTPEAGIIGHVMTIRALVNGYNIDLTKPTGISELSAIYVYGNPNKPSESWTSKVSYLTEQNKTKELFLSE